MYQTTLALSIFVALAGTGAGAVEPSPQDWFNSGAATVKAAKHLRPIKHRAKNVILFIGDGMGISTVTAARILDGQINGGSGEENSLSFEKFPYLALSKTYSVNQQTPDSAPTMTAMVTGVKTNDGELSVSHLVSRAEKSATVIDANKLTSILEMAENKGLSTGIVTTTRITHATPAATYAHTSERDWESDADKPADASVADIASQLLDFKYGDGLEVALGGGRSKFYSNTEADPEYPTKNGSRKDGRSLYKEWTTKYANAAYVWNKSQFYGVNPATTDHLLGLFERSHMHFDADRSTDIGGEPSLDEMADKAIDVLKKNSKGYFLMVEGGRIDHGHHAGNAYRALTDAIAFSKAVQKAVDKTNPEDTLIIVTADHSHVFTIAGYPKRGNPILGKVVEPGKTDFSRDLLGLPYTTLSYANGPGYAGVSYADAKKTTIAQPAGAKSFAPNTPDRAGSEGHVPLGYDAAVGRPDLTTIDTTVPTYLQESMVPMPAETHAGEDVAIFARGPKAYLIHGVLEQNVIFHVMNEALGLNRGRENLDRDDD
jgi:alkaline phosphatase